MRVEALDLAGLESMLAEVEHERGMVSRMGGTVWTGVVAKLGDSNSADLLRIGDCFSAYVGVAADSLRDDSLSDSMPRLSPDISLLLRIRASPDGAILGLLPLSGVEGVSGLRMDFEPLLSVSLKSSLKSSKS